MKIFFVSGTNGVGKSTLIPFLQKQLPSESFEVHDFDERGVPYNADAQWRANEAQYWISEGRTRVLTGKSFVICGFVRLDDLSGALGSFGLQVVPLLLDASPETVRARLLSRYAQEGNLDVSQTVIGIPIEHFIENSMHMTDSLHESWRRDGFPIIATDDLSPEEVAHKVTECIINAVSHE